GREVVQVGRGAESSPPAVIPGCAAVHPAGGAGGGADAGAERHGAGPGSDALVHGHPSREPGSDGDGRAHRNESRQAPEGADLRPPLPGRRAPPDILNGGAPVTLLHRQGEGEGRTGVLPPGAEEAWLCRGGTTQIPEGKRRVVGPVGPGRG